MTQTEKIPFVDLVTPHKELENELVNVFKSALGTASFIGGPLVEGFERDFAQFCKTRLCVGVSSGTDALRFALMAAGVQPGDIVLTVPLTFIATTEAITQAGARADFVDVDPRTYTMDPEKLKEYLEIQCVLDQNTGQMIHRNHRKPVRAVIPVHLYGQTADMDPILELAARYKMVVIEDACQAHGAEYFSQKENRWRTAGSMGHAAAFSFSPGKNLGACGEGGAVTTSSGEMAHKVRMLRDHGQARKYFHDVEGYNGRLDSIQAGILSVKLQHLDEWNRQRQQAALRYHDMFSSVGSVIAPYQPDWSRAVYHLSVIRVQDRERLRKHLAEANVDTGVHYPLPLHLQKAYANLGGKQGDFPITERISSEILSLPMYPRLEAEQQRRIVQKIVESVAVTSLA